MNTNKGRMGLCRLKNLVVQLHDQYSSFFTVIILDKTPTADNQQKRVQVRAWTDLVDTLNQTVKALRREGVRAQVLDEIPPFLLNRGFLLEILRHYDMLPEGMMVKELGPAANSSRRRRQAKTFKNQSAARIPTMISTNLKESLNNVSTIIGGKATADESYKSKLTSLYNHRSIAEEPLTLGKHSLNSANNALEVDGESSIQPTKKRQTSRKTSQARSTSAAAAIAGAFGAQRVSPALIQPELSVSVSYEPAKHAIVSGDSAVMGISVQVIRSLSINDEDTFFSDMSPLSSHETFTDPSPSPPPLRSVSIRHNHFEIQIPPPSFRRSTLLSSTVYSTSLDSSKPPLKPRSLAVAPFAATSRKNKDSDDEMDIFEPPILLTEQDFAIEDDDTFPGARLTDEELRVFELYDVYMDGVEQEIPTTRIDFEDNIKGTLDYAKEIYKIQKRLSEEGLSYEKMMNRRIEANQAIKKDISKLDEEHRLLLIDRYLAEIPCRTLANTIKGKDKRLRSVEGELNSKRPYMSIGTRLNWSWVDFTDLDPLDVVHVPFSKQEKQVLLEMVKSFPAKKTIPIDWHSIAMALPGRRAIDCFRFHQDLQANQISDETATLLAWNGTSPRTCETLSALIMDQRLAPTQIPRTRLAILQKSIMNLKDAGCVEEGSGDVVEVRFGRTKEGLKIAIASCCEGSPEYNRLGNLRLCDVESHSVQQLQGHKAKKDGVDLWTTVTSVKFSNDGRWLFSAGHDNTAKIWASETGELLDTINKHQKRVNMVAVKPNAEVIATGSDDGSIYTWRIEENGTASFCEEMKNRYKTRSVNCIEFGHEISEGFLFAGLDGNHGRGSGAVRVYDYRSGSHIISYDSMESSVGAIACSPSGRYICCGTYGGQGESSTNEDGDGFLRIFDYAHNSEIMTTTTEQLDVNLVSFSPNELLVASCGTDNRTVIFDWRYAKYPLYILAHDEPLSQNIDGTSKEGITGAQWVENSDFLFTGGADSSVKLWNLKLNQPLIKTYSLEKPICSLSFVKDDLLLAVGVIGGSVHFLSSNSQHFDVDWKIVEKRK